MIKRNLVTSLLLYEKVRTTRNRARAVQPLVDRLLRAARKQPTHVAIRTINSVVTDKNACRKIMEVLKARYVNRQSGLTRIVPAGTRQGDGAMVVDLVLVDTDIESRSRKDSEETKDSKDTEDSRQKSSVSSASSESSKSRKPKKTSARKTK